MPEPRLSIELALAGAAAKHVEADTVEAATALAKVAGAMQTSQVVAQQILEMTRSF